MKPLPIEPPLARSGDEAGAPAEESSEPEVGSPLTSGAPPHEHEWWGAFETRRVPVINGVAVMPWGATIESDADEIEYPIQTDGYVCSKCGILYAERDTKVVIEPPDDYYESDR